MTTKPKAQTAKALAAAPRKPTYRLYRVDGEGQGSFWTPIGAAWPNKDGKGFSLQCDAVPITGRIVLRLIEPKVLANGGQP